MKQKEIRNLIRTGVATDITNYNFEQVKTLNRSDKLETIAVSYGTYGMNGGLFRSQSTGKLYAVSSRAAALFVIV